MGLKRTAGCNICDTDYTETKYGEGFPNWSSINGLTRSDGNIEAIWLCPKHSKTLAKFMTAMSEGKIK